MLKLLQRPLARLAKNVHRVLRGRNGVVEKDFREFQQRYAWAGSQLPPAGGGRRLLIASLCNWLPQVKMESVLARTLMFEDFRPIVATQKRSHSHHRYHRTFGIRDFAAVKDFASRDLERMAAAETKSFLDRQPTFRDVLDFQYRGVQVGRHVLSTVVCRLRSGSIEFTDPQVRQLLGEGLRQAIRYVHVFERMLDQVRPDLVLLLERGYVPYGEIFDVALNRGIPVIQYCHSHRKDALLLKRYTPETRNNHPWSLSPASWRDVKSMPWSSAEEADLLQEIQGRYQDGTWFDRKYLQSGKSLKSADEVCSQLGLDPQKKTAVIFSHMLWDATFFYGTNLFDDYEHWLVETVMAARENPAVNWVVKLHPDYVWKMKMAGDTGRPPEYAALEQKVGRLPDHVKVLAPDTDISTFSLFDVTDWCLTVRGTIGIELSCFGTPVLTAGTGRYSGLGFTVDSTSRREYLEKLRHIEQIQPLKPAQIELARRHAYGVFRLRPVPFQTFELVQDQLESLGHALDHNLVIRANSLDELRQSPDLQAFAHWAARTDQEDLLVTQPPRRTAEAA